MTTPADPADPDEMQERLDHLGDEIEHARHQAEADDLLFDPNEPRYYESGDLSVGDNEDDQNIAPF